MRNLVLACLLVATTAFAGFEPVREKESARCAFRTFEAEYANSAAVFEGKVLEASKEGNKRKFSFKIHRFWKGVNSKKVEVSVYENPRFQSPFKEGKTFLVFAKANDDGSLIDGRCSHSAEIDGYSSTLKDDLEKLGEAKTCIDLDDEEDNDTK